MHETLRILFLDDACYGCRMHYFGNGRISREYTWECVYGKCRPITYEIQKGVLINKTKDAVTKKW